MLADQALVIGESRRIQQLSHPAQREKGRENAPSRTPFPGCGARCGPTKMPASTRGEVQTARHEGSKIAAPRVSSNGEAPSRTVDLGTEDHSINPPRAFDHLVDVAVARKAISQVTGHRRPEFLRKRRRETVLGLRAGTVGARPVAGGTPASYGRLRSPGHRRDRAGFPRA